MVNLKIYLSLFLILYCLFQVEIKHARSRIEGRARTGHTRGPQITSVRTSRNYGLSAFPYVEAKKNRDIAEAKLDKATTKAMLMPTELDLRASRGHTLGMRDGEGEVDGEYGKRQGRLNRVREDADEEWKLLSVEQKKDIGRRVQNQKIEKEMKKVRAHSKELASRDLAAGNIATQIVYFKNLATAIAKNYHMVKDLTAIQWQQCIPVKKVESLAWDECTSKKKVADPYPVSENLKSIMTKCEPNTVVTAVCRVYQRIYKQKPKQKDCRLPEECKCAPIPSEKLRSEPGDLFTLIRGDKNLDAVFIVTNVVLNPLRFGIVRVDTVKTAAGGWVFNGAKTFRGSHIQSATQILGTSRGWDGGDFWGFNLALAKPRFTDSKLLYEIAPGNLLMKDLATKNIIIKSEAPKKTSSSSSSSSSSSNPSSSSKNTERAFDRLRLERTKLEWVLDGERGSAGAEVRREQLDNGGVGLELDEGLEEGGSGDGEGLGSGGFDAGHASHAQQVSIRQRLDIRTKAMMDWFLLSVSCTTKFSGAFVKAGLSGPPSEAWGLVGRVGPRCASTFLRIANATPNKTTRMKFADSEDVRREKIATLHAWCLLSGWIALRIDQELLESTKAKLKESQGSAHTLIVCRGHDNIDPEVESQYRHFVNTAPIDCDGWDRLREQGKETLIFCNPLPAGDLRKEEEEQWERSRGCVEECLEEFSLAEGTTVEDVEMEQ